jgi:hypothetical protein
MARRLSGYFLVLSVLASATANGCYNCYGEPGVGGVTFENRTDEAVTIYKDGHRMFDGEIPAWDSVTVAVGQRFWREHLTALDQDGRLIWEAHITLDQLKEMGNVVVIEPEFPAPTPQPTRGGNLTTRRRTGLRR